MRDDQNLPPGLHIRMNLATGVKEAKLNEPVPEQNDQEGGLVVIEDVPHEAPKLQVQPNPQHTFPVHSSSFDVSEGDLFRSSVSTLKSSLPPSLEAFSDLQDLAHSSHWGLTLARDSSLLHLLFQFLSPTYPHSTLDIRSTAALLLGTAIHNNPPALTVALSQFYNDEWPTGPLEAVILALAHEQLPTLLNRMMFLLSGLCQDEAQLQRFVNDGGLELLVKLFNVDKVGIDERDKLRGKIVNFMVDHFLQFEGAESDIPIGNEKQIIMDMEPDSHLDNEDSWVMFDQEDVEETSMAFKDIIQKLKPWCSLFEKCAVGLTNKIDDDPQAARIFEDLNDARSALEKKLNAHGCGCLRDC